MDHWPHGPKHMLDEAGTYIVTGATRNKELLFKTPDNLDVLQNLLLEYAKKYNWHLDAWAVFPNHYHFVAQSPENSASLRNFVTQFHSASAKYVNRFQNKPGRQVWHQYWDTQVTFHQSYLARLNYVIQNPVRHGIVTKATLYNWCSASWFEQRAEPSFFKTVVSFKTDSVKIIDDF